METWTLNTTIDELVDDGLQVGGLERREEEVMGSPNRIFEILVSNAWKISWEVWLGVKDLRFGDPT